MGRLYQLLGALAVYIVFNYVYTECKGLRYRNALRLVLLSTIIFVIIGYKDVSMPMVTYLLIGLIGIPAVVYGIIYNHEVLLIVAATYIPFNLLLPADFGGVQKALNGTNIILVALILGWMFGKKKMGASGPAAKNTAIFLVIAFSLLSIIAYVRGGIFHGSAYLIGLIFPLKRWLTPMIMFVIFFRLATNRQIIKVIFSVLMLVIISNIFFGILEWVDLGFGTYSYYKRRLGGFNMHPNFFGAFIAYYVCILIGPFLTGWKKPSAKLLIIPFLVGLRIIIPTNSRGAWIGLPPALLTVAFLRNKMLAFLVIGLFFIPIIIPSMMPDTVATRLEGVLSSKKSMAIYEESTVLPNLSESKSISFRTRYQLMEAGWELMKENPWFGVGWGVFPYMIGNYNPPLHRASAHNMFLRIVCEMGWLTLVTLLMMLFVFFKAGVYVYRREKDTMLKGVVLGYTACVPAIIFCNLTGNRWDSVDVIAIFWMLSACVLRLQQIIKSERLEEQYRK
jgi:O-antigen ligase